MMKKIILSRKEQRGAALIWGLVILLALTIIVLAGSRMGNLDARFVTNQLLSNFTYQSVENGLEQSGSLFHIEQSAKTVEGSKFNNKTLTSHGETENVVEIKQAGSVNCARQEGIGALSIEMNPDAGRVSCTLFRLHSTSGFMHQRARKDHAKGVMRLSPPTSN